jgi:uncharacterized membrane protein YczE
MFKEQIIAFIENWWYIFFVLYVVLLFSIKDFSNKMMFIFTTLFIIGMAIDLFKLI